MNGAGEGFSLPCKPQSGLHEAESAVRKLAKCGSRWWRVAFVLSIGTHAACLRTELFSVESSPD